MSGAAVAVTVKIAEDKIDEFLKVMEQDAAGTRKEPGCLRFDVLRSVDDPCTFVFYEAYTDDAAVEHHRSTDNYKAWAEFKAAGGVQSQTAEKLENASIPGEWAFQKEGPGTATAELAVLVTVEIEEAKLDEFLKVMQEDAVGSRNKEVDPGCLRFDFLRHRETQNKFVFYEIYTNGDAIGQHKTTAHYKAWADFKAAGGVLSQTAIKLEASSFSTDWALQA
mmetsp:Transcript_17025/g.30755  ORF Transcript_17025/g.30755 Transcript_17025/m.30755 type:complete len:222 (-) Transcript_17025:76-741(-)